MAVSRNERSRVRARELAHAALAGVRLHPLRSTLSLASFTAATAAAIALLAITGGAREELLTRIRLLGANLVRIESLGEESDERPSALTLADAGAIQSSFPFARTIAPVRMIPDSVQLPDERFAVEVIGTTPDYFALRGLAFRRGRPFSIEENARGASVCVAGHATARRLARNGPVYGSFVKIGERWCRVVGILETNAITTGEDTDRRLYVPIHTTLRGDLSERQPLEAILLRIQTDIDPERAADAVEKTLLRRHGGVQHFAIGTAKALLGEERRTRGLLDTLLGSVALFALGLGGIALGSQSWQAVSSRRREIAIRRTLGAKRSEILSQFLLEGVLLALAGAILGVLLGTLGAAIAARLGDWPWTIPGRQIAATFGLVGLAGVAATLYPAYRAAILDPVEALRQER